MLISHKFFSIMRFWRTCQLDESVTRLSEELIDSFLFLFCFVLEKNKQSILLTAQSRNPWVLKISGNLSISFSVLFVLLP